MFDLSFKERLKEKVASLLSIDNPKWNTSYNGVTNSLELDIKIDDTHLTKEVALDVANPLKVMTSTYFTKKRRYVHDTRVVLELKNTSELPSNEELKNALFSECTVLHKKKIQNSLLRLKKEEDKQREIGLYKRVLEEHGFPQEFYNTFDLGFKHGARRTKITLSEEELLGTSKMDVLSKLKEVVAAIEDVRFRYVDLFKEEEKES